jgi:hypothetical protein
MGNKLIKFIYDDKKSIDCYNNHWEYCCTQKIPCIRISKSGTKYWKIDCELLPINMLERFWVINIDEHIRPLYKLYSKYAKIPLNKSLFGNGSFIVFKKDAPDIAEKLFDLLMLLSKRDQELFDENPFTVNKEGFNSEGFRVTGYTEKLNKMSDDDLISEFRSIRSGNPLMLQTLELIKSELTKRNITNDKYMR